MFYCHCLLLSFTSWVDSGCFAERTSGCLQRGRSLVLVFSRKLCCRCAVDFSAQTTTRCCYLFRVSNLFLHVPFFFFFFFFFRNFLFVFPYPFFLLTSVLHVFVYISYRHTSLLPFHIFFLFSLFLSYLLAFYNLHFYILYVALFFFAFLL